MRGEEEEEEDGLEVFDPGSDLQPEVEEEDMNVFQSNAGARGKGEGAG